MASDPHDITRLLAQIRSGDRSAVVELIPLVYSELRAIAAHFIRQERPGHTLQATAVVHEAYIRMASGEQMSFENRAHFFGVAARLMRWILSDYARRHAAAKRSGEYWKVPLQQPAVISSERSAELLALDEALERLEKLDPRQTRIVELRYYSGLSVEETAVALGISAATVKRDWTLAKSWLKHELRGDMAV